MYSISVFAPPGQTFVEGSHCLCTSVYAGDKTWISEAVRDTSDRMDSGLVPCSDRYCDICGA